MSRESSLTVMFSALASLACLLILQSCSSKTFSDGLLLRIDGKRKTHQGLGSHVEQFADVDDDGVPDIIASSPHSWPGNFNVYSGTTGQPIYMIESKREQYQLQSFAVVADLNGDEIPEIVGPDTWADRGTWIFSGKDGSPMFKLDEKLYFPNFEIPQVVPVPDKNADGVPDLVASLKEDLIIFSGKDGETIRRFTPSKYADEMVQYFRSADADGDGNDDLIVFSYKKWPLKENLFQNRVRAWFLSTTDFSLIGEPFDTPFTSYLDEYACADMNGDGVVDLIGCDSSGGEPAGSLLAAVSAKDSSEIWRVNGRGVEGGAKMFTVDAKTGKTTEQYTDVQFAECLALLPDMNADGVPEVATGHPILFDKQRDRYGRVYVFSGSDGSILNTIYPPKSNWRIGNSVAPYADWNFDGTPDILVGAYEYRIRERQKVGSILVLSGL